MLTPKPFWVRLFLQWMEKWDYSRSRVHTQINSPVPIASGRPLMKLGMTSRMASEKGTSRKDGGGFSRIFGNVANKTSQATGQASAFMVAAGVVLVWAITGPLFQYSDTWQLVINSRYDDRHISDGLSYPEFAKSRQRSDSGQARRTHSRQRIAQLFRRHRASQRRRASRNPHQMRTARGSRQSGRGLRKANGQNGKASRR